MDVSGEDGEATLQRGRAPPVQREPYAQETQEDWEYQVLTVNPIGTAIYRNTYLIITPSE